jgi:hypothetical protein
MIKRHRHLPCKKDFRVQPGSSVVVEQDHCTVGVLWNNLCGEWSNIFNEKLKLVREESLTAR